MAIEGPTNQDATETSFTRERRNIQRQRLVYYLRAWDTDHSQMLGHISNFTSHGLMLISEEPIQVGGKYSLEVRLPDNHGNIQPISFRAVCRWSGSNIDKSLTVSGFEVLKKTSDAIHVLQSMTNAYGFGV